MNPFAFPFQSAPGTSNPDFISQEGMTLRDYFAAKAMQGFCANQTEKVLASASDKYAGYSFIIADAMLKAREQ